MNELSMVRGLLTLLLMLLFITLTVWLYARRHRHVYDQAARLPLEEDAVTHAVTNAGTSAGQPT